jgi:hypothetical protein
MLIFISHIFFRAKKDNCWAKTIPEEFHENEFHFYKWNLAKAKGVAAKKNCWEEATLHLNAMENGSVKTWQQWRKVSYLSVWNHGSSQTKSIIFSLGTWNGFTWDIRKKFTEENKERGRTGGGPLVIGERSAEVQKMMAICGNQYCSDHKTKPYLFFFKLRKMTFCKMKYVFLYKFYETVLSLRRDYSKL